jgi:glutathione peroxidase-family protein
MKYTRYKHGEANFTYIEKFDSVEKAADPSNEGQLVEVKVNQIKWNFTKVKEDADGTKERQKVSAKVDGSTEKKK